MKQNKPILLVFITTILILLPGCWGEKKNTDHTNYNHEKNKHESSAILLDSIDTSIDVRHKSSKAGSPRLVTVKNAIEKEMLGYKKFGTHYPDTFRVLIDGKELMQGQQQKVTIRDNILVIRYEYRFGKRRDGAKLVYFELDPKQKQFTLTFKWKDDWRILINNATPLEIKEIA